jgi:ribosomal protein S18 acetylase RimI-like enzyme
VPVYVRAFVEQDARRCGALIADIPFFGERYGMREEGIAARLLEGHRSNDAILVAGDGERVDGFAWVIERGAFARSAYLQLFAVAPERQQCGYGAALLQAAEARAAVVGPDLFLLVSDFNRSAQRFYSRRGYVEVGRLPDFVIAGVAELILRKRLST